MAQILINEISQNYTYNIGSSSFATVALPITACWGPAFMEGVDENVDQLESLSWQKFPATQQGLESFVSTYRGPASIYRVAKDYSYQQAMTLLTAGYDILVCRLCPGGKASGKLEVSNKYIEVQAKYPGSFGDNLKVVLSQKVGYDETTGKYNKKYWNMVVYIVDSTGVQTAVENLIFVSQLENVTDSIPHIEEIESHFIEFGDYTITDDINFGDSATASFTGGSDFASSKDASVTDLLTDAYNLANTRYTNILKDIGTQSKYVARLNELKTGAEDSSLTIGKSKAEAIRYKEWLYTKLVAASGAEGVFDLLKDKLTYNPQRIISPGWDDQNIQELDGSFDTDDPYGTNGWVLSPIHIKLLDVSYNSRCATALLDVPKSLPRSLVHRESTDDAKLGYAQKLARYLPGTTTDVNGTLYATHGALFAPWGQYTYVGTSKQATASPAFLDLMINRAMILNQTLQYEWALPTNRKHNLKLGKFDYIVPNKLLKQWQKTEGVGINVITTIPDLCNTIWGNSTLYEVPPATYQALANLSTRYLVNAVEDVVYRCGISITFQYNNEQAYNKFYAGVTPILDTMKNVGAIDDYYVKMAADINGLDQVNSNTVIGKIYLVVNGVINDIIVDLVALPPGTDLNQYKA